MYLVRSHERARADAMVGLQSADVARVVTWPGTVAVQASEARPQRKRRMEGGREGRVQSQRRQEQMAVASRAPDQQPTPDPRPHMPNLVGLLDEPTGP